MNIETIVRKGRKKLYETEEEAIKAKNSYYGREIYLVRNRARYHTDIDYNRKIQLRNRKANEIRKQIMRDQAVLRTNGYIKGVRRERPITMYGLKLITKKRFLELIKRTHPTLVKWKKNKIFTAEEVIIPSIKKGKIVSNRKQIAYCKSELIEFLVRNKQYVGLSKTK